MLWSLEAVSLWGRRSPRLNEISLAISAGTTAVLGKSGVGKTSLLNLLVEFERPSSGKMIFHQPASLERLSRFWAPPQQGLWPHLSVREHLTSVMGIPQERQTSVAEELLAKFDLQELVDTKPGSLSLGERSRLNVARALASDAHILVMDEPLAHVDTARSGRYWKAIREHLKTKNVSMVFATHSPEVVCVRQAR